MFNNASPYNPSAHPPLSGEMSSVSGAITESESLAKDIKEGTLSGYVGNGTVLHGEAAFRGMLRVEGRLSGRVSSQDGALIVGTNGRVDADVEVAVATIQGTVNGDIIASKRVEIGRAAKVTGNIRTPRLVIEEGAIFEGSCRMVQPQEAGDERRTEEAQEATSAVLVESGGPTGLLEIDDIAN